MLGEYVENMILAMDKGGGGYHFIWKSYIQNLIGYFIATTWLGSSI